ncbi:MAG: hypothetical protein JW927_06680 [Deltaproteobacteria bacterium]|nr:hypothetical protein [Deltaproteobacteria bacterium]
MKNKLLTIMLLAFIFSCFSGCTYKSWYEGLRETERQNCNRIENTAERQKCLDEIDKMSYEQYQKERDESNKEQDKKGY